MTRYERKYTNKIFISLFLIAFIAVGYALVTANIEIRANLRVAQTSFDVHFENIVKNKMNSIDATPILENNNTSISVPLTLSTPGDLFEFDVDIVNSGSLDASLNELTIEGIPEKYENTILGTLKYKADSKTPQANDVIVSNESDTLTVRIEYNPDVEENELIDANETFNLSVVLDYTPKENNNEIDYSYRPRGLYGMIVQDAVPDNIKSKYVTKNTGIDFSDISSDTNGKGVYIFSDTLNDTFPVYYYRGDVENNNIIVGPFCWKIVRTTSDGDIKLIYNGPSVNGKCFNKDNFSEYRKDLNYDELALETHSYGRQDNDNAYVSLYYKAMWDENYNLINTTYSYEEMRNGNEQNNVLYFLENAERDYYELARIKYLGNSEVHICTVDYNKRTKNDLCNDRRKSNSPSIIHPNDTALGYGNNKTYYFGYDRVINKKKPSLDCEEIDNYNAISKYGLLTVDEFMLSGYTYNKENKNTYIPTSYLGHNWTITPANYEENAKVFYIDINGKIDIAEVDNYHYYLYTIVIDGDVSVSGNGTSENPYEYYNSSNCWYEVWSPR